MHADPAPHTVRPALWAAACLAPAARRDAERWLRQHPFDPQDVCPRVWSTDRNALFKVFPDSVVRCPFCGSVPGTAAAGAQLERGFLAQSPGRRVAFVPSARPAAAGVPAVPDPGPGPGWRGLPTVEEAAGRLEELSAEVGRHPPADAAFCWRRVGNAAYALLTPLWRRGEENAMTALLSGLLPRLARRKLGVGEEAPCRDAHSEHLPARLRESWPFDRHDRLFVYAFLLGVDEAVYPPVSYFAPYYRAVARKQAALLEGCRHFSPALARARAPTPEEVRAAAEPAARKMAEELVRAYVRAHLLPLLDREVPHAMIARALRAKFGEARPPSPPRVLTQSDLNSPEGQP